MAEVFLVIENDEYDTIKEVFSTREKAEAFIEREKFVCYGSLSIEKQLVDPPLRELCPLFVYKTGWDEVPFPKHAYTDVPESFYIDLRRPWVHVRSKQDDAERIGRALEALAKRGVLKAYLTWSPTREQVEQLLEDHKELWYD